MEELAGTLERFLFNNKENGYCVFVMHLKGNESITVKGHAPALQAGQQIVVKGSWIFHPKFGKQFEATSCSAEVPTSLHGLKKYLGSGMIKGIGKAYAEKLVDYFGSDILKIIDESPERLEEVPGIGSKRLTDIITAWKDQKEIATVMVFLQDKGISGAYATRIYKQYGQQSIVVITENPYRIAHDIWGIGFKSADTIAQNLGFTTFSPERIVAGIMFALTQNTNNGHLYAVIDELKELTKKLLELPESEQTELLLKNALHALYNNQKIKLITHEEKHYVTLSSYYYVEKTVAQKLLSLHTFATTKIFPMQEIYQALRVQPEQGISLNDAQQEGILRCLQTKVSIITGGPGTGKTTLIKKLLEILDTYKVSYKLAAPTGRAAKRMNEGTGKFAVTLHRLLEFNPHGGGFTFNEMNALKLDFLIVDEASMIDIFLANALLKALPLTAHVIFIGDIDQLPSVGAGNFLRDTIASGVFSVTHLQYIFRQAHNSLITYNAHQINKGLFPSSSIEDCKQDYLLIKENEVENLQKHLNSIVGEKIKRWGIKPENCMVLSPMNRGSAGTIVINHYLQALLNPDTVAPYLTYRGTNYKKNDRVMQIRNNYDKNIFNGDIGIITGYNAADQELIINFFGTEIIYQQNELDELVLAYAVSIHKSQGSEFDAVIIPLFMQHFTLLQRNLLYTALTRAKKLCILIGQPKAIIMAIKNNKSLERLTFLKYYLTTNLECR